MDPTAPNPGDYEAIGVDVEGFEAFRPLARSGKEAIKPPHSAEAELEVLSAPLVDAEAMVEICEAKLKPSDFYFERNQILLAVMLDLRARKVAIDSVTIQQALKDRGQYEKVGGPRVIGELLDRAGTVSNLAHYIGIVRDKAVVRQWLEAARSIETKALQDVYDVPAFVAQQARLVEAVRETTAPPPKMAFRTLKQQGLESWLTDDPPIADALLTWPSEHRQPWGTTVTQSLLVPAGCVSLLGAAGGTGKGWVLMALAVAIATGTKWLGTYQVPTKGRVLLALGEEDNDEAQRRLWAVVRAIIGDPSEDNAHLYAEVAANVVIVPMMGQDVSMIDKDGNPTPFYEAFKTAIGEDEYRAALVDPLSRFGGPGIEDDAFIATRCIQLLEGLTKGPGKPAVIASHHTKKVTVNDDADEPTQGMLRGHSALVDGPRCVLLMASLQKGEARKGRSRMYVVKGNRGPKPSPLDVIRGKGGVLRPLTPAELDIEREEMLAAKEAKRKVKVVP